MVKNPSKYPKKRNLENPDEISSKKRKMSEVKSKKNPQNNNEKRVINLYCPAVSKRGEIVGCGEQNIELGRIASMFGIEPGSVKLNRHFIGRGLDYIATSVTWISLLSFFSSKGFSTGLLSSAPIIVDGNIFKSGSKRSHEPSDADRGVDCIKQCGEGVCRFSHREEINSPNSKKFKESNNAQGSDSQTARHCDSGLKRRHLVEDTSPFKKSRTSGGYSSEDPLDDLAHDPDTPTGVNVSSGSSKRSFKNNGGEANADTATSAKVNATTRPAGRDTSKKRQKSMSTDSSPALPLVISEHLESIKISRQEALSAWKNNCEERREARMERADREKVRIAQREREHAQWEREHAQRERKNDVDLYLYLDAKTNKNVEEEMGRTKLMRKLFL